MQMDVLELNRILASRIHKASLIVSQLPIEHVHWEHTFNTDQNIPGFLELSMKAFHSLDDILSAARKTRKRTDEAFCVFRVRTLDEQSCRTDPDILRLHLQHGLSGGQW